MSDLFIKLIKHTAEKEDFFTECLAATLREDPQVAKDFVIYLCGEELDEVTISATAVTIETQVSFIGSCIDMVITLNGRKTIATEHKLWSPQAKGQLSRYLKLGFDRLAFITGYHSEVSKKVFDHPCYMKPLNGRKHFMWSDFYELLEKSLQTPSATTLNRALLTLFRDYGFEPPKPEIGDLLDPDPAVSRRNRKNFAKFWELTRRLLRKKGWKEFGIGSIAELYVSEGPTKRLAWAWLDPIWQRGSLRIRLTLDKSSYLETVEKNLLSPEFPFHNDINIVETRASRKEGREEVLDILIPMKKLLADAHDAESISKKLAGYVLAVFDTVG